MHSLLLKAEGMVITGRYPTKQSTGTLTDAIRSSDKTYPTGLSEQPAWP